MVERVGGVARNEQRRQVVVEMGGQSCSKRAWEVVCGQRCSFRAREGGGGGEHARFEQGKEVVVEMGGRSCSKRAREVVCGRRCSFRAREGGGGRDHARFEQRRW